MENLKIVNHEEPKFFVKVYIYNENNDFMGSYTIWFFRETERDSYIAQIETYEASDCKITISSGDYVEGALD